MIRGSTAKSVARCPWVFAFALLVAATSSAVVLHAAEPKAAVFKTAGGTEMNYITLGDSGPWVVLIPGATDTPQRMYVDSGIAAALAKNHRVVATPDPMKMQPGDVMELVDYLKIDKAHLYGYSMGGGYTGTLLALHPKRWITAAFGGSGIWEYDQKEHDRAYELDQEMFKRADRQPDGRGGPGGGGARGGGRGAARGPARGGEAASGGKSPEGLPTPVAASRPHSRTPIDLYKVEIPILAVNGAFDQPFEKSERMFRELRDFTNVILPGHDHMSAIGVRGTFPPQHIDAIVRFINANDPKP